MAPSISMLHQSTDNLKPCPHDHCGENTMPQVSVSPSSAATLILPVLEIKARSLPPVHGFAVPVKPTLSVRS